MAYSGQLRDGRAAAALPDADNMVAKTEPRLREDI
jgi:hypothetical protein